MARIVTVLFSFVLIDGRLVCEVEVLDPFGFLWDQDDEVGRFAGGGVVEFLDAVFEFRDADVGVRRPDVEASEEQVEVLRFGRLHCAHRSRGDCECVGHDWEG